MRSDEDTPPLPMIPSLAAKEDGNTQLNVHSAESSFDEIPESELKHKHDEESKHSDLSVDSTQILKELEQTEVSSKSPRFNQDPEVDSYSEVPLSDCSSSMIPDTVPRSDPVMDSPLDSLTNDMSASVSEDSKLTVNSTITANCTNSPLVDCLISFDPLSVNTEKKLADLNPSPELTNSVSASKLMQLEPTKLVPAIELTSCLPPHWDLDTDEVLVCLEPNSAEYAEVKKNFCSNAAACFLLNIDSIYRVQNPTVFLAYELKKAELQLENNSYQELKLMHGTKELHVMNIVNNNLDWRKFTKKHWFGQGVSFSPLASYASHYTDRHLNESGLLNNMFLTKVLVGDTCLGSADLMIPPKQYDTTINQAKKVYIKYDDWTYYPEYLIKYSGALYDFYMERKNQEAALKQERKQQKKRMLEENAFDFNQQAQHPPKRPRLAPFPYQEHISPHFIPMGPLEVSQPSVGLKRPFFSSSMSHFSPMLPYSPILHSSPTMPYSPMAHSFPSQPPIPGPPAFPIPIPTQNEMRFEQQSQRGRQGAQNQRPPRPRHLSFPQKQPRGPQRHSRVQRHRQHTQRVQHHLQSSPQGQRDHLPPPPQGLRHDHYPQSTPYPFPPYQATPYPFSNICPPLPHPLQAFRGAPQHPNIYHFESSPHFRSQQRDDFSSDAFPEFDSDP